MMFERLSNQGDALVTVNRTNDEYDISLPSKYDNKEKTYCLRKSNNKILTSYGGIAVIKK